MKQLFLVLTLFAFVLSPTSALAEDTSDLEREIEARESKLQSINARINEYKNRLNELSREKKSLQVDLELIQNQIALTQLDIEAMTAQIETKTLMIDLLNEQIANAETEIDERSDLMGSLVYDLHMNGNINMVEVLLSSKSFNELLAGAEYLEELGGMLGNALEESRALKAQVEEKKQNEELVLNELKTLEDDLESRLLVLERQNNASSFLLAETSSSESEYNALLREIQAERGQVDSQLRSLQLELEERLREESGAPREQRFIEPVSDYILTASFNDPTYPFRHLFEHSGIDMAAPTGTPVRATEDGIVAWNRVGRSYGNYVMVIHENGFASLYAHLSGFGASVNQYVSRGDIIGYVGSTGFSTGPHLHFEIRKDGIPVNPASYIY
jgi:murein DD-endopeptidase MepM/ murein hydrolase activator NlpD